jgi:hypothetical protein
VWDASSLTTDGTLRVVQVVPPTVGISTLPDGNFGLSIAGTPGQPYTVRASTDIAAPLASWQILTNGVMPAGGFIWADLSATNYPSRNYIISHP